MKEKCQWGKENKYNLRYIIWQKKALLSFTIFPNLVVYVFYWKENTN